MDPTRFAVLGHGRFGQALVRLLDGAGYAVRVHDPVAAVPLPWRTGSLREAVADVDMVVLAMPVPAMRAALEQVKPLLHAGQVVFDVGSVKLRPCATMDEVLGSDIAHVGSHPLFGPISLARGDKPRRVVVCPSAKHVEAAEQVRQLFRQLDCEVIEQTPEAHDRAMARTHAMAFFVAKGLIRFGVDDSLAVAPPSFQGVCHMLDAVRGDAGHLYAAIQRGNPFADTARRELIAALQAVDAETLAQGDDHALDIPGA